MQLKKKQFRPTRVRSKVQSVEKCGYTPHHGGEGVHKNKTHLGCMLIPHDTKKVGAPLNGDLTGGRGTIIQVQIGCYTIQYPIAWMSALAAATHFQTSIVEGMNAAALGRWCRPEEWTMPG